MKILKGAFAAAAILAITTSATQAREIREFYNGVRPLGMGNAFVGVSDDFNAMYYNPAGLKLTKDSEFTFAVRGEASPKTKDIMDTADSDKSEREIAESIESLIGERGTAGAAVNTGFVSKDGWALGIILANAQFTYDIKGPASLPSLDLRAVVDTTISFAMTRSFLGNRLHVGLSPRFTNRVSFNRTNLTAPDIAGKVIKKENFGEGYGIDANLGFLYKLPFLEESFQPRFGLVIKNMLATKTSKLLENCRIVISDTVELNAI